MKNKFLNNLNWHDSVLQEITFIRTNSLDQVILLLNLIADYENQVSELTKVVFKNCLMVNSKMLWGISCMSEGEMIYSAETTFNKERITKYMNNWNIKRINDYREFKLELASTGSELHLIYKDVEIIKIEEKEIHNAPPHIELKK